MAEIAQGWAFPALPNRDCELKLLRHLSARALATLGGTCRAGFVLTRDEALWEVLCGRAYAALVRRARVGDDAAAKSLRSAVRGEPGGSGGLWRDAFWASFWARSRVRTWGSCHRSQTGHGQSLPAPEPLVSLDYRAVVEVSCGGNHSVARTLAGDVYCWGWGDNGQLGRGNMGHGGHTDNGKDHIPARVRGIAGATRVAAGQLFSVAVTRDGQCFCWGANGNGQLGIGSTESTSVATIALGPGARQGVSTAMVVDVACGQAHVVAKVRDFGDGGGASGRREVSRECVCVAWGRNSHGQVGSAGGAGTGLGHASLGNHLRPCLVTGLPRGSESAGVQSVAAGANFSVALVRKQSDGIRAARAGAEEGCTVWMWGQGKGGACGTKGVGDVQSPVMVKALENEAVVQVACGAHHCVAATNEGAIWGWGLDSCNQLGGGGGGGLGAASASKGKPPHKLDAALFSRLPRPVDGHALLLACGVEHTLVGVRGAELAGGLVVLGGTLGVGCSSSADRSEREGVHSSGTLGEVVTALSSGATHHAVITCKPDQCDRALLCGQLCAAEDSGKQLITPAAGGVATMVPSDTRVKGY